MARYKAIVAGASGIVGRGFIEVASAQDDWEIIGLSRRIPDYASKAKFVSVDLLDRQACQEQLGGLKDVTHIVYTAVAEQDTLVSGWKDPSHASANLRMLQNLLDVVEANSPTLRHVTLLQGTKAYGGHYGTMKLPGKETDPRHMPPNFYYEQQDFLRERQASSRWTWTVLRPQAVIGFAVGAAMNLGTTIAVYAAISKELGLPLRFPGTGIKALWEAVDSHLLSRAILWAATTPGCGGEIFNVTNGDILCWESLWPRFAQAFGLELGHTQPMQLASVMADKGPLWAHMVERHSLQPFRVEQLASWQFADHGFNKANPLIVSTVKIRQFGFHECIDTEEMFLRLFQRLKEERIVPA